MAASSRAVASAVSASVEPDVGLGRLVERHAAQDLRQGELVLRCGQLAGGEVVEQAQRAAGVDQLVARGDPEPVEEAGQERVEEHDPGVVDEEPLGFLVEVRGRRRMAAADGRPAAALDAASRSRPGCVALLR